MVSSCLGVLQVGVFFGPAYLMLNANPYKSIDSYGLFY